MEPRKREGAGGERYRRVGSGVGTEASPLFVWLDPPAPEGGRSGRLEGDIFVGNFGAG